MVVATSFENAVDEKDGVELGVTWNMAASTSKNYTRKKQRTPKRLELASSGAHLSGIFHREQDSLKASLSIPIPAETPTSTERPALVSVGDMSFDLLFEDTVPTAPRLSGRRGTEPTRHGKSDSSRKVSPLELGGDPFSRSSSRADLDLDIQNIRTSSLGSQCRNIDGSSTMGHSRVTLAEDEILYPSHSYGGVDRVMTIRHREEEMRRGVNRGVDRGVNIGLRGVNRGWSGSSEETDEVMGTTETQAGLDDLCIAMQGRISQLLHVHPIGLCAAEAVEGRGVVRGTGFSMALELGPATAGDDT